MWFNGVTSRAIFFVSKKNENPRSFAIITSHLLHQYPSKVKYSALRGRARDEERGASIDRHGDGSSLVRGERQGFGVLGAEQLTGLDTIAWSSLSLWSSLSSAESCCWGCFTAVTDMRAEGIACLGVLP